MRVLAIFCGAFSLGIFLCQFLLPAGWLLPGAFAFLLFACAALRLPPWWRRRGLLVCVALALALGYDWLYLRQVQQPMLALADTESALTMTICSDPIATSYGTKTTVKVDGLPAKAVYYGGEELLACVPGQQVSGVVHLQSAAQIRESDVTAFTSQGIFLLAYQRGVPAIRQGSATSPRWWPLRVGRAMKAELSARFTGDTAGFLTAILTGDKSALSEGAAADLSEAGLYHVLAVSGMHCGFLLAMVMLLAGKQRRRLVAACAIPLLWFYALLTGGSPSVLRACVMLTLLAAAPLFYRDSDGPTAWSLALFLILVKNPFAAASVSLQLSFAAMAGILFLTPRLHRLLKGTGKHGKVFHFIEVGFSTTMGALLFTVPLCALYFGTLTLISPISNLLCLWAAGIAFVSALMAVGTGILCPPLGAAAAVLPGLLARYILGMAHGLAQIPYHGLSFQNPYLHYWLLFAYALFAAAFVLRPKSGRKYALTAGLSALTLAVTVLAGKACYGSDLDAVMLDVGQGESVALGAENAFALVDCGSADSWYHPGEKAANQMRTMGCRQLDYLILTHYDADHISGVEGLLARMKVGKLLVPEGEGTERDALCAVADAYGVPTEVLTQTQTLPLGDAVLTVFPPLGRQEDNERGLSVLASVGSTDLLMTGDMSAQTEQILLDTCPLPDLEYLAAGHHGSKNATSAELLDALTPETVLISVGASNRYGHPAPETLRRLSQRGCTVCRTDLQGDIHLSMNRGDDHGIREKSAQN